jgi:hypothetical protein
MLLTMVMLPDVRTQPSGSETNPRLLLSDLPDCPKGLEQHEHTQPGFTNRPWRHHPHECLLGAPRYRQYPSRGGSEAWTRSVGRGDVSIFRGCIKQFKYKAQHTFRFNTIHLDQ